MILEKLIPLAYAQTAATAAKPAAKAATTAAASGTAGIQKMIDFILSHIGLWITAVVIIFISYAASKMLASAIKNRMIEKHGEDIQENLLILIERVTSWIVVGLGVIIALAINGLNFAAVIGAFSLGIGFALKDVISNFISSIMMLAQSYIRIGDLIEVGGVLGRVSQINTRVSVLNTLDGQEVLIPNQVLLTSNVTNYTKNPFRRLNILIGVDYKTDLHMVTTLIRGVIDKDPDFVPKPAPMVVIEEFGASSINIRVYAWIETGKSPITTKSNLSYRIKKAFDECGVNIPFPIQTLKLDEDDRAFLKTMESMKKGYIPEIPQALTTDEIRTAAEKTAALENIPHQIFKPEPLAAQQGLTNLPPVPATVPVTTQDTTNAPPPSLVGVGASGKTDSSGTPPTHL